MFNFRLAVFVVFALFLAACSTQPQKSTSIAGSADVLDTPLGDAKRMFEQGRLLDTESLLAKLDVQALSESDQILYHWISAKLAVALGRGEAAILSLNSVPPGAFASLTDIDPNAPGFLRASALHLKGEFVASARERIFLSGVLSGEIYDQNHQAIWASLMQAEMSDIETLGIHDNTSLFKGWLDLALIMKRNQIDVDKQIQHLRLWQAQYDGHPAERDLPGGLAELETYAENKAKYVAIMLPLSGKLKATGRALRDGIMAAYYEAKQAGAEVPEINIYDTAQTNDFWQLYKQAILDGNEMVIGPLTKSHVERLQSEERLPVPTLALNYGLRDKTENPEQLFQFGLAVEDEADLAALYARQQGYKSAIALLPKGQWGERVFKRFSSTWQQQGGHLIEAQFFNGKGDYNRVISRLLAVDDSERRARSLKRQLGESIEFQARRRQDVDFIFVAALPEQARQIKPTLAFNFANDLPMIATSQIYSGKPSRSKDRDLNNVVFCDIPWMLENTPLKKSVHALWPQSRGGLDRLYALGVDAFRLYPRLGQIKVLRHSSIPGVTGELAMDEYGQIVRTLPFAVFENGTAKKTQGYVHNVQRQQAAVEGI